MLKTYADYDAIAKAGKLNELTIPELVKFLNEQKTVMTAEQSLPHFFIDALSL